MHITQEPHIHDLFKPECANCKSSPQMYRYIQNLEWIIPYTPWHTVYNVIKQFRDGEL